MTRTRLAIFKYFTSSPEDVAGWNKVNATASLMYLCINTIRVHDRTDVVCVIWQVSPPWEATMCAFSMHQHVSETLASLSLMWTNANICLPTRGTWLEETSRGKYVTERDDRRHTRQGCVHLNIRALIVGWQQINSEGLLRKNLIQLLFVKAPAERPITERDSLSTGSAHFATLRVDGATWLAIN